VVAADVNKEALDALQEELGDESRVLVVQTDVTDPEQTEALAEAAVERFGTPYGLVNSAGISCVGSLLDVDPDAWRRVMAVNVDGTLNVSRVFVRRLVDAEASGSIVNFSSGAGIRGVANRIGYVASKFAVTGMTFTMALVIDGSRMRLVLRRWTVFGVPLPMWLCPRSDSYETAEDGRFHFHVEISHALTGLMVRYRGWLEPR